MILPMGDAELEMGSAYLGELRDSTAALHDFDACRQRMADDGYLLLRGFHDADTVRTARRGLLENLAANGQIDTAYPLDHAVIAGQSGGQFLGGAKAVSHTPEFLAVVEGAAPMEWFANFLDGPSLTFDYKWIRAVGHGAHTGAHFDVVYMGRGTRRLYTVWTPLGDVAYEQGPLAVVGGSTQLDRVRQTYGEMDVDRDHVEGWFSKHPAELVERYNCRWLTSEFAVGDVMIFGMYLMHGSLNNTTNRFRLSCDTRYQRADEPVDERWVGENPKAHYGWHAAPLVPMEEMRAKWGV